MTEQTTKLHILLVEDNPIDVLMTRKALERWDIATIVHVAKDGQEALDFLYRRGKFTAAFRPDLVFLDLNLPKKNGIEVLSEIDGDPDLSHSAVVVVTTSDTLMDVKKCHELGADLCIIKPIDFDAYTEKILSVQEFLKMRDSEPGNQAFPMKIVLPY